MYSCQVKSLVYYEHHENDYVMQHQHNCYECVFYQKGKGTLTVDNEVYQYEGPCISIVSSNLKHDEKTEEFTTVYIVLFDMTTKDILKPFTLLKLGEKDNKFINKIFEKLCKEEKNKEAYYHEMMSSYFNLIITKCLRLTNALNKKSPNKELVRRIKDYIKENYKQNIDFSLIASTFGYSYDRFRHIFKEETGTSINQYLLNCRLYAAKQMLLNTTLSIKEIAIECGFKSYVYFNNFFTEKMNISPLQFRNSSKNQIDINVIKIERS
ncbi:MAG: AraC family transcriptional regulator [Erysipelotrichaceae bacterium]|nr:AraC family transcriptional regulator [Erysipelotrichaceae bacterium]